MRQALNNEKIREVYLKMKKLPLAFDGNKKKIFNWIMPLLVQELQDADIILDGFSGTGIISAFLAMHNHQIYACDMLYSAHALTTTLSQNPGENISDEELNALASHRCIDGVVFDHDGEIDVHSDVYNEYPGIFTKNEALWLAHINSKIGFASPYKQLIAHCAIRGISTIIPFSSSNGTKKFQYRIYQKDKYQQRCLGFYYNSSYEIEYIKWFKHYVMAFNDAVNYFATNRQRDAIVYHDDIFNVLERGIKFDAAYLDPPYGRKNRISYEKMYAMQERLLGADEIPHAIFSNPEDHAKNFIKLLEACHDIPKIIFSYDNNSWASINEISLICKRFGRTIDILSTEHCHGKIPMDSHNSKTAENLIIAKK